MLLAGGSTAFAVPYIGEPVAGWGAHVSVGRWTDDAYKAFVIDQLGVLKRNVHRVSSEGLGAMTVGAPLGAANTAGLGDFLSRARNAAPPQQVVMKFGQMLASGAPWPEDRIDWHVKQVAGWIHSHGYSSVLQRYEGINEPDIAGLTPEQVRSVQAAMWAAIRSVNPTADVGTSPTSTVNVRGSFAYIDALLAAPSILEHATHFSIHAYDLGAVEYLPGGGANNNWVGCAWQRMQASGGPIRPLCVTEGGANSRVYFEAVDPTVRAAIDYRRWTAVCHYQWFLGMARAGVKHGIQYALLKTSGMANKGNNLYFYPGEGTYDPPGDGPGLDPEPEGERQYIYSTMRDYANADRFQLADFEGTFETPQHDVVGYTALYPWHVPFYSRPASPGTASPFAEWDRVFFRRENSQSHTGSGCLEMQSRAGKNEAWRLVTNLEIGRPYALKAWVRTAGGAAAMLKACGMNAVPLAHGPDDLAAPATSTAAWTQQALTFTPTNPWVVIVLHHNGAGTVWWDDVTLALADTNPHVLALPQNTAAGAASAAGRVGQRLTAAR